MMFKKNKSGQAAIEFLMTYGWMLLVVLIVGALIFSFVDFGSLLPNKIELNNNFKATQTESFASVNGGDSYVTVPFKYSGTSKIKINGTYSKSLIKSDIGSDNCTLVWVKNAATGAASSANAVINGNVLPGYTATSSPSQYVTFISGQIGIAVYDCHNMTGSGNGLLLGDALEGKITLYFENVRYGIPTPSSGPFRILITE